MVTAAEALQRFHAVEGLPEGGTDGAGLDWAHVLGIPVPVVNTRARLAVLPFHDLHHVATGYRTDEVGEAELGAWTLAAGAGGGLLGLVYDLGTFGVGWLRAPRRTVRAFVRGCRGRTLYAHPLDELLALDHSGLCDLAGTEAQGGSPTLGEALRLVGWTALAAVVWLTPLGPLALAAVVAADRVAPQRGGAPTASRKASASAAM